MAITIRGSATGGWNSVTASTAISAQAVGTFTTTDRLFVFGGWKDFSLTAVGENHTLGDQTNFTEVTEFADGAVAAGNGTGSMKVGAWYRDYQSGDEGDNIGYRTSANMDSGGCINIALAKDAGESWDTPLFATAAWPVTATTQTISASSTVAVPNGSIVMAIIAIRDDSSTFTRGATTGIDVASGITWAANYVEDPATHLSSTLGGDMAADLGYRFVTTGGTVTLRVTATILAVETGSILWVVQGVSAAAARVPKYKPMPQLLAH